MLEGIPTQSPPLLPTESKPMVKGNFGDFNLESAIDLGHRVSERKRMSGQWLLQRVKMNLTVVA